MSSRSGLVSKVELSAEVDNCQQKSIIGSRSSHGTSSGSKWFGVVRSGSEALVNILLFISTYIGKAGFGALDALALPGIQGSWAEGQESRRRARNPEIQGSKDPGIRMLRAEGFSSEGLRALAQRSEG